MKRTSKMYGWRAKLGFIIPSNNTVIEPELVSMAPPGVSVHGARILTLGGQTPQGIVEMEKNSVRAGAELIAGALDVLGYACLSTSLVKGIEWSRTIADHVAKGHPLPVTTAATATIDALHHMGARRVAFATPYPDRINVLLKPFVEQMGIDVVAMMNLNIERSLDVCRVRASEVYTLAKGVDTPEAEAVCIVATDLPTVELIAALEGDLRKPVVSTNQAMLWQMLQLAKLYTPIAGYGSLLSAGLPRPMTAAL